MGQRGDAGIVRVGDGTMHVSRSVLARDGQQFRYQVPLQGAQILEEDTEYLLRSEIKAVDSPY